MNPTLLSQIYRKNKIKKRAIRWTKKAKNMDEDKLRKEIARVRRELVKVKKQGYRVVYLNETMVIERQSRWLSTACQSRT